VGVSGFESLESMEPLRIWDGVRGRRIAGDGVTFAVIEMAADATVPEHQHPNEQLGVLISGSMTFRIADETRQLRPGDTWNIPGNVPHEVHAGPDGAVAAEVFSPRRDDWAALERDQPSAPRWP
jgi:quercetin dioxygenase-like cupin family protein